MGDNLFHIIEGAQVIVHSGGVFKQNKVFRRGNRLYAQWGGGFIRLDASGGTSAPKVSWEDLDLPPGVSIEQRPQHGPRITGGY